MLKKSVILIALLLLTGPVFSAGSSASYKISVEVLDSGGIKGTSASYQLLGKTRDRGVSVPTSASFKIGEGFLRSAYGARVIFAPLVTAIDPSSGTYNEVVSVTISGANFVDGATVKLSMSGEDDIAASNVVVEDIGKIKCDLDIRGAKAGLWSVTVTNPDGRSGTLPAAFKIIAVAPTVTSITPSKGVNNTSVDITDLAGKDFRSGAQVKLSLAGESDIYATNVSVVSSSKITCRFDLNGKTTGIWDVTVVNDDGLTGTLTLGFKLEAPFLEVTKPIESEKNPFNPTTGPTTISYNLSKDANMTVYIFNIRGERIWEYRAPAGTPGGVVGENKVLWDGITTFRESASIGAYIVHLTTREGGKIKTLSKTKIAVIK